MSTSLHKYTIVTKCVGFFIRITAGIVNMLIIDRYIKSNAKTHYTLIYSWTQKIGDSDKGNIMLA